MAKHDDDDPVMMGYGAFSNITFHHPEGGRESGYTWGDWREMSQESKDEAIQDFLNELVEVWVLDEE
jgi:hypothetical protein